MLSDEELPDEEAEAPDEELLPLEEPPLFGLRKPAELTPGNNMAADKTRNAVFRKFVLINPN